MPDDTRCDLFIWIFQPSSARKLAVERPVADLGRVSQDNGSKIDQRTDL